MDCTQQDVVLPWHAAPTLPAFPRSHSKNCGFHPDLPRMERHLWGRSWLSVFKKPPLRSAIERYFAEEWRERERDIGIQRPTFHSCGHVPECRERGTKVSGNGVGRTKSLLCLIPTIYLTRKWLECFQTLQNCAWTQAPI